MVVYYGMVMYREMVIHRDFISYDMVVSYDMVICNDNVTCFDTVILQDRLSVVTWSYVKCEMVTYRGIAHMQSQSAWTRYGPNISTPLLHVR